MYHAMQFHPPGHFKDITKRAEAFKSLVKQLGCTVKEIY
jgi:hypothetical protein